MKELFERLVTGTLAAAALVIAILMLRRELSPREARTSAVALAPPTKISQWEELLKVGRRMGSDSAAITIIEFGDLECPFCAKFHDTYRAIRQRFGDQISLVFLHHPLPAHRFARPAARAAECAASEGLFGPFVEAVFRNQDSLGLKTWVEYASGAGVTDTVRFRQCATDTMTVRRVEDGLAIGKQIGVRGTPTIGINGWRYDVPPSEEQIERAIRALLAGKDPP